MTNPNPVIPMKNWLHEADPALLASLAATPAAGRYYVPNQFGIDMTIDEKDDASDYRALLLCETGAEDGESILDAITRLNRRYTQECQARGLHPRFMLALEDVDEDGRIVLKEMFFLANWYPVMLLKKNQGRARGTYTARDLVGLGPDHGFETFDLSVTAETGENVFELMYRLNREYVAECARRGLEPDEELVIEKVTYNKNVVITK